MEWWERNVLNCDDAIRAAGALLHVEKLPGVHIRVLEMNGRRRVVMELADDTSTENLRDAIPCAREWQRTVKRTTKPSNSRSYEICGWHTQGKSYAEIAKYLNWHIAFWISASVRKGTSLYFAECDLDAVGFDSVESKTIIADAIKRIKHGEEPFESGYPIDRPRIIRLVRDVIKTRQV